MQIAISLLGGLGLFLYGMNMMGDVLQKSAGEQLKKIIGFLTSNVEHDGTQSKSNRTGQKAVSRAASAVLRRA